MSADCSLKLVAHFMGLDIEGTPTFSGDQGISIVLGADEILGGKAGTLSTRTDNDTGVLTLSGGHGIVQNNKVDLYWGSESVGGAYSRRRMNVSSVNGNDVTVDGGAGTVLPSQSTAVVAAIPTEVTTSIEGIKIQMMGALLATRGILTFLDDQDAEILGFELRADRPYLWWIGPETSGNTYNPLTDNIAATVTVSCGATTSGAFSMGVLLDSVT